VDAPGNDGNAPMPEQVKRPNPWRKMMTVLHYNLCLTTEYSETTALFNGNFDTDNQIYVP
jgi:hypothetical protein